MKTKFCFVQLFHISERGGGAEVQANFLAIELVRRGFEVHYICQTLNSLKVNQIDVISEYSVHWLDNGNYWSKKNLNILKEKLIKINPDVIIERMSSAMGIAISEYKISFNKKYIWICTDNNSSKKYKNITENFKKLSLSKFLFSLPRSLKMDNNRQIAIKKSDVAFHQNLIQKNNLLNFFGKESFKMISGHPQPDIELNSTERFSMKTILWAANWGKHKRPELFMEIARELIDSPYRFVMLGGHSDKAYVSRLIAECPKNIEIKGQLSFEEASEYFDYSSILINTSVAEGYSNTYIQSWLRGIPTIVFGADPDQIIQKNNLGFDVVSVSEGVDKIKILLTSENIYDEISKNCLTFANNKHSIDIMTDNFLTVIKNEGITLH